MSSCVFLLLGNKVRPILVAEPLKSQVLCGRPANIEDITFS